MAIIEWDKSGERLYETGVKNGVLYVKGTATQDGSESPYVGGVAWNGLTAVTESPSGAEASPLYADDTKYLNLISNEDFGGTIEAYTYPDEFKECNGELDLIPGMTIGAQSRKTFGFCYRTTLGNDEAGNDYGYKLHLVYGATAAVSEKAYATINDSPEAITFSWEFTTTPVAVTVNGKTCKPTACVTIDSTKFADEGGKTKLKALEDALYGTATAEPYLPLPAEVYTLLGGTAG
jgi:hypothetical protein